MPFLEKVLNISSFVTLVLAFGAAVTSLGLTTQSNNGMVCLLFVGTDWSVPSSTCGFSLSAAIIAVICLTVQAIIELIKVVFGIKQRPVSVIFQAVMLVISTVFLFINMITISAGWAKTCKTWKNSRSFNIDCNTDNASEGIVGAAVFSSLGFLFTVAYIAVFVVLQVQKWIHRNRQDYDSVVHDDGPWTS